MNYQIVNEVPKLLDAAKIVSEVFKAIPSEDVVVATTAHLNGNFVQSFYCEDELVGFANYQMRFGCLWR